MNKIIYILIFIILLINFACTNPFAPGLSDYKSGDLTLGDQRTREGVFQNFRYAYFFKDTLVYGKLLADDFVFVYRSDNDIIAPDKSWGRTEDMITTFGLFNAAQNLDLIWNDIILSSYNADSTIQDITRSLSLTIVFSSDDIVRLHGWAIFTLIRKDTQSPWLIAKWRDESNYF